MKIEYTKGERADLLQVRRPSAEGTSGRKMKVMLIFPPDCIPRNPI